MFGLKYFEALFSAIQNCGWLVGTIYGTPPAASPFVYLDANACLNLVSSKKLGC